jgi:hypothetical protein
LDVGKFSETLELSENNNIYILFHSEPLLYLELHL